MKWNRKTKIRRISQITLRKSIKYSNTFQSPSVSQYFSSCLSVRKVHSRGCKSALKSQLKHHMPNLTERFTICFAKQFEFSSSLETLTLRRYTPLSIISNVEFQRVCTSLVSCNGFVWATSHWIRKDSRLWGEARILTTHFLNWNYKKSNSKIPFEKLIENMYLWN